MTERPEGLDDLLDFVAKRMDPLQALQELHANLKDEDFAELMFRSAVVHQLMMKIDHYEKHLPSWAHGTPQDVDRWLHSIGAIPEDKLLAFYQWIGKHAVREAVGDLRRHIGEDPVPVQHRSYSPDGVHELINEIDPDDGPIAYPSELPKGHPFCDVAHHTHTGGGGRLPTCRLDSEE